MRKKPSSTRSGAVALLLALALAALPAEAQQPRPEPAPAAAESPDAGSPDLGSPRLGSPDRRPERPSAASGEATPEGKPAAQEGSAEERHLPTPRWEAVVGRVLLAGHTSALDSRLDAVVGQAHAPSLEPLAEAGDWFGSWGSSLPYLVAGSAAVGGLTEGRRGLLKGGALLAGVLAGSMANEALNQAVGRERPTKGVGAYTFRPFNGHASFPSGHTAYAFGIAGGIDAVTDGWVPAAAAYGAATLTGLSRIYDEKHWFSDVAVGAFIGAAVSRHAAERFLRLVGGTAGGTGPGQERPAAEGRGGGAGDAGGGRRVPGAAASGADAPGGDAPRLRLLASPGRIGVGVRF